VPSVLTPPSRGHGATRAMGLSERFELIHAKEKRVAGTAQHGSRGGRPDKRTRAKLARKATLASAMSGRIGKGGKNFGGVGGGARARGGVRKAQFQAELVARVAAASGPGGWQAAWDSAYAGAWQAASAESWGQAGAGSWDQAGWQTPTGGSTVAVRAKGKGKGRGGGSGAGKGRGGWGQQGLAMQWRRPPSAEEQAVLDALPVALPLALPSPYPHPGLHVLASLTLALVPNPRPTLALAL